MPLDRQYVDPILNAYRDMKKDCDNRNLKGELYDEMVEKIETLERYVDEFDDFTAFNIKVMDENLYTGISMLYTRMLNQAAKPKTDENGNPVYNDEIDKNLLLQTLSAYKNAIEKIKEGKQQAINYAGTDVETNALFKEQLFIKPIEEVIKLGESGVNYPVFLRIMIEKGMDKAMESSVVTRDGLVFTLEFYKAAMINPHYIDQYERQIKLFDELADRSKFKAVNILQFNLGCEKIEFELNPKIKMWESQKHYWERVIESLSHWITSYCSFAPFTQPWSLAKNPRAAVIETQECEPGYFEVKSKQLMRYHGISFQDIFSHETFRWEVTYNHLWYSMEYIQFLRDEVFPHCRPGNKPPAEIISKAEKINADKKIANPEMYKVYDRNEEYFDRYFGAGYYKSKGNKTEYPVTNAAPWDLAVF